MMENNVKNKENENYALLTKNLLFHIYFISIYIIHLQTMENHLLLYFIFFT